MTTIKDAASTFLAHRRVAVTGVSREAKGHGGNVVHALRDAVTGLPSANATEVEGDLCFSTAVDPGGVEAVVVATRPRSPETVRECADLDLPPDAPRPGPGSVPGRGRIRHERSSTQASCIPI
jgi:hypothetical protein